MFLPSLFYEFNNGFAGGSAPLYNLYKNKDSESTAFLEVLLPSTQYKKEDLEVFHDQNNLIVKTKAEYRPYNYTNRSYIKEQIVGGPFSMRWKLNPSASIKDCKYENGLLTIKILLENVLLNKKPLPNLLNGSNNRVLEGEHDEKEKDEEDSR